MQLSVDLMDQVTSQQEEDIKTIILNSITKLLPTIVKELTPVVLEKSKEIIEENYYLTQNQ